LHGHELPGYLHAFYSRCRLPELFRGHDVYVWIDADAWIQEWDAIEAYVHGALRRGFAVTLESDSAYNRADILAVYRSSLVMFGGEYVEQLATTSPLNAGVFAGRVDAPHWRAWQQMIEANILKADSPWLLFFLDQTALCIVCGQKGFEPALLPTICNWISHQAHPMTSDDGSVLLRPLPPHEPLAIVHQTNVTKRDFFSLPRYSGGFLSRTLGYQAHSQLAADDYVSPGFQVILPDRCFPNIVRGNPAASTWPYLRRGLPHAWLVDRRWPSWGVLNRDEAHVLYNLALGFHAKRALEIGCHVGWSTCHMALAGVDVDTVDPTLAEQEVRTSVETSIQSARCPGRVNLVASRSPNAVHELAEGNPEGWSLFLIDGDHEGDAPLNDVRACLPYAAPDCAMVFHDLASPCVTNAVVHLKEQGWNIRVYHTAQIMAVAWRGSVRPVAHQPDPRVDWQIPDHVMPLLLTLTIRGTIRAASPPIWMKDSYLIAYCPRAENV
jgi:predicted O-methyltransferase YrrM